MSKRQRSMNRGCCFVRNESWMPIHKSKSHTNGLLARRCPCSCIHTCRHICCKTATCNLLQPLACTLLIKVWAIVNVCWNCLLGNTPVLKLTFFNFLWLSASLQPARGRPCIAHCVQAHDSRSWLHAPDRALTCTEPAYSKATEWRISPPLFNFQDFHTLIPPVFIFCLICSLF